MPHKKHKLYGPYEYDNGRLLVNLIYSDGSRETKSYPRYLVEKDIGKLLAADDTVHHINGDYTDNDISNLEVVNKVEHAINDAGRYSSIEFDCPICDKRFILVGKRLSTVIIEKRRKHTAGPFCSKSCVGKYGAFIQNGGDKMALEEVFPKLYNYSGTI